MSIFKKTIFTGFAPNLNGRDTALALSYLFLPWRWSSMRKGGFVKMAEEKLRNYFSINHAYIFDSGRWALYYALKALEINKGDEVLVQAYTCVVVINAIKQAGGIPIYIDIGHDFNIDPESLKSRLTNKSKILIIQHTFGLPARLDAILKTAKTNNLKVIEDCAQSLGARYYGKLTGTFGQIGLLSFGSDKIISCVRGGALITGDPAIGEKIKKFQAELKSPNVIRIIQHLLHYPIFYISKPVYHLYIGKIILKLAKTFNITNKIIYKSEKAGKRDEFYPTTLANSLANILCRQLDEINSVTNHGEVISEIYNKQIFNQHFNFPWKGSDLDLTGCAYLRYPLLTKNPKKLAAYAKTHGIILGDWYNQAVAPKNIDLAKTDYVLGSCPKAEFLAAQSINLPTDRHITKKYAVRIVKTLNAFMK